MTDQYLVIKKLPRVASCDDSKYPWEVIESGIVLFEDHFIFVPIGYKTDLASVPRIPFVYARYGGRAREAAIIHDYLYDRCVPGVTRKDADWIFLEVMKVTNDPPSASARLAMWAAVRAFGWRAWRKNTRWKCR